jgi:hypothetical protein
MVSSEKLSVPVVLKFTTLILFNRWFFRKIITSEDSTSCLLTCVQWRVVLTAWAFQPRCLKQCYAYSCFSCQQG